MKKIQVLVIGVLACLTSIAQPSNEPWGRQAGGDLTDHSNDITTDSLGNIYITGGFQSFSTFESQTSNAHGDTDIFIAKYTKNGVLLWMQTAGSDSTVTNTLSEYGNSILIDHNFIYVSGVFLSKAKFDNKQIKSEGSHDIFIAKYTLDGKLLWVKSAGGENQDIPYALSADYFGNIYLTGSFQKKAHFGNEIIAAMNSTEMFLAKYTPNGDIEWVRKSSGELKGSGKAIGCYDNYCFVAGEFQGNVSFGINSLESEAEGVFINKYSLSGDLVWSKQIGENSQITVEDLLLWRGEIYLTGSFTNRLLLKGEEYLSNGGQDLYITKLSRNGDMVWVSTAGGSYKDEGKSLSISDNNQLLVGGNFQHSIKFKDFTLPGKGTDDIFIASFSNRGRFNWSESFGGLYQDQLNGTVVSENSLIFTGFFRESIQFKEQVLNSKGLSDVLIVKVPLKATESAKNEKEVYQFILYPNPSKDYVVIESAETIGSVKIYDLLGRLVLEKNSVDLSNYEISLKEIISGTYLVEVNSKNKIQESKLVINK